jgi:plasmid stabilization system protein ParE
MILPELRIAAKAQTDLRNVLRYSRSKWGIEAGDDYLSALQQGIDDIGVFPGMGSRHDELPENVRILPMMSHRIIYRTTDTATIILRVIHHRRRLPKVSV